MLRIAIAALLAASLVIAGPWVLDTYTVNILVRAFFVALAALTVDVLWGVSGTLTFGQSAFFGIGGYALAIVFTQFGFGPGEALLALGAAVGVAAIVAGLVGWLSFYPGSTPLYASVISLVLPIVLVQILYSGGTFTGSSSGLVGFESFDVTLENWFRLSGLAVISALVVTWIVLRSDAGRVLGAMRDNDERCSYLGIDTARVRIGLLVVAAIVAALAGFGYVGFGAVAAPENAGFVFGTQLVVMVALGGRGSLIGAVIGAVVIEVASAYLSSSFPFVWELIVGIAFVMVIVLLPGGLLGGLRDLVRGIRRRIRPAPAIAAAPVLLATLEHAGVAPDRNDVVVDVEGLSKHFGSLTVLSNISFSARQGELVSLVGPNGAGKTTLIRCLADGSERSEGNVRIAGRSIERLPADRIVGLGLGRKFQAASVFETLSVADCLRVARVRSERPSFITSSPVLSLPAAARAVVESSGLVERLGQEARFLSHGLKQALELAMVLALEPKVLLLDEPTAGLTRAERQGFAAILTALVVRDRLCVLIIEHDLDFVRQISSRIIVLHQGRIALDGPVAEVVDAPLVREIYTGRPPADASGVTA
ncbi:ABC transporter permease subunit [Bradyrhizobium erythrophlei]|nr:ATP-binding cassette domain-containing protein [Bradyrhizobium erythrophlei]